MSANPDVQRLLVLIEQHNAAKAHTRVCWEAALFAGDRHEEAMIAERELRDKIKDLVFVEWGEVSA